jgi:LysM repeat protein
MKPFTRIRFFRVSSIASILLSLSGCATLPFSHLEKELKPEDTLISQPTDNPPPTTIISSPMVVRSAPIRPIWYQAEPKEEPQKVMDEPIPALEPTKPQGDYTVQKGDTLCKIARRFHISLQELMEENHLDKNTTIYPGQKIILPGVPSEDVALFAMDGNYKVRPGDTLFKIAKRHSVTVSDLKSRNNLRNDRIVVGQTLTIPHEGANFPSENSSPYLEKHQSASHVQPYSDANGIYIVQRGDSLFSIAKKTGTTFSELQALNSISNPRNLQIGQKLIIHPEAPSSMTTFTSTTQTVAADANGSLLSRENPISPPLHNHSAYNKFMEDADFFKEDIDTIPVVQIREE